MVDTPYVRGADKLRDRIATIRKNLNLPAMVNEIGDLLLRRTKGRFDREVDPDNTPWVPLADSTLKRKKRKYGEAKKLVRTGALRSAISIIKGNAAGATYTNTGAGVRIGIKDPAIASYAAVQNRGNGRIPARRFLGIGALDVKSVDSYLRRQAAKIEG